MKKAYALLFREVKHGRINLLETYNLVTKRFRYGFLLWFVMGAASTHLLSNQTSLDLLISTCSYGKWAQDVNCHLSKLYLSSPALRSSWMLSGAKLKLFGGCTLHILLLQTDAPLEVPCCIVVRKLWQFRTHFRSVLSVDANLPTQTNLPRHLLTVSWCCISSALQRKIPLSSFRAFSCFSTTCQHFCDCHASHNVFVKTPGRAQIALLQWK